jgi:hypothetical protein
MGRKVFVVFLLLGGCGAEQGNPSPSPSSEFKSEVQLGALLPAGAQLTGVAVTPEGQTYVLDQRSGLYEIGKSTAKLVFATSDLATRFGISPAPMFTDVAALGAERFALTAENDGFMLDLHGGTFTSYFCYLPAPGPSSPPQVLSVSTQFRQAGIAVKERTESVAFSPDSLQLFAQPQTIRLDTGEVVGSELFVFPESGGQPTQVTAMAELGFLAGGMVAVGGQSLLLGAHDRLYRATATGLPTLLRDFEAPIEIVGMARADDGALLLLDGAGQRLLEVSGY